MLEVAKLDIVLPADTAYVPGVDGAVISANAEPSASHSFLLGVLVVFATLESVVGFCAGCWMFGQLMRLGVIPEETRVACADIWRRA